MWSSIAGAVWSPMVLLVLGVVPGGPTPPDSSAERGSPAQVVRRLEALVDDDVDRCGLLGVVIGSSCVIEGDVLSVAYHVSVDSLPLQQDRSRYLPYSVLGRHNRARTHLITTDLYMRVHVRVRETDHRGALPSDVVIWFHTGTEYSDGEHMRVQQVPDVFWMDRVLVPVLEVGDGASRRFLAADSRLVWEMPAEPHAVTRDVWRRIRRHGDAIDAFGSRPEAM